MEIVPNVHLVPGVIANPYLILEANELTLIDAGMPGRHRRILRYMAYLEHSPDDLKRIIITHADFDHVGGLAALKAATGVRVYASAAEATAIATGNPSRPLKTGNLLLKGVFAITGQLLKAPPAQVDELVAEGHEFPVLGGLRVVETFGHTPGHISLFAPSVGVLFVGDSLVSDRAGLRGSRGFNTWDQDRADAAVRKQAALGARIICAGHGPVVKDVVRFPQV